MSRPNPVDLPDRIVDKTTRSGWTRHKYADGVCWRLWKHRNGKTFRIQVFISDLELVYAIHGRNVAFIPFNQLVVIGDRGGVEMSTVGCVNVTGL